MIVVGVVAAVAGALCAGSVFVPMKPFPTGDGFFAQLMMCLSATVFSVILNVSIGCPPVYPLAMLGGAIWCIANAFAIQIMSVLGMALAILIWNTTSCLTGWAIGRFGLFGIAASVPASNLLNAFGVALLIAGFANAFAIPGFLQAFLSSGTVYLFIKSVVKAECTDKLCEKAQLICLQKITIQEDEGIPVARRAIATAAAVLSGVCYGLMTTPATYIQQHPDSFSNAPRDGLSYIFSFFCGVIITSTLVFVVYALKMRHRFVEAIVILPAMCSGVILAGALTLFFTAIEHLSQTIAYPVCSMLPGLVVSAWSVLYFKEIKGRRNLLLLGAAYSLTLLGVVLVTISKEYTL